MPTTDWLFSDYGVSPETHAMIAAAKEERDD